MEGKASGAKLIVFDTRLSNTATHADHFIAPYPGSEAAILLAIANYLIQNNLYNREFVRRWWNWEEYQEAVGRRQEAEGRTDDGEPAASSQVGKGGLPPPKFEEFESTLKNLYSEYTFEFAARESGVEAKTIEEIAKLVAMAGTKLSSHNWRSVTSGVSHGWTVARALFM